VSLDPSLSSVSLDPSLSSVGLDPSLSNEAAYDYYFDYCIITITIQVKPRSIIIIQSNEVIN